MSEATNQDICSVLDQFQRSSKKSIGNANLCIVIKSTSKRYTYALEQAVSSTYVAYIIYSYKKCKFNKNTTVSNWLTFCQWRIELNINQIADYTFVK